MMHNPVRIAHTNSSCGHRPAVQSRRAARQAAQGRSTGRRADGERYGAVSRAGQRVRRKTCGNGGLVRALLFALLCGFAAAPAAMADPMPPDQLVRTTADEVLAVLRADPDGDMRALSDLVDKRVVNHFDFGAMTRLAVGKYWRQADSAQQATLTSEFRTLLVRTYSVALKAFVDYHIDYRPLDLAADDRQATVQTMVSKDGGKPIRMDYRMIERADGWKVYDVLVDGVSLVVNYRSLFGSTVERSGIGGLIKLLHDKNAEGATG